MAENNEAENQTEILPGYSKVDTFYQDMLRQAMMVTKASNSLPDAGGDWDYYSSFPGFSKAVKYYGEKITDIMTSIYNHYGVDGKFGRLDTDEQVEFFSDGNDVLMEKINIALDEAAGIKKQVETIIIESAKQQNLSGSWNRRSTGSQNTQNVRLLSAKNILRPQLKFKDKIDNRPGPFVPKIKEKPNSVKPLAILLETDDLGNEEYSHPYEFELEHFAPKPEQLHVKDEAEKYPDLEETPLLFVESEATFAKMMADLTTQTEIAVDLEHHSYRTYQGLTCLMQISTRKNDYIVDTLQLWDQLQPLNEVFTNPKIVKVLHGADKDVEWLQRDLGVYVVNMFDTYQAAKLLNYQHLSLSYLVHYYCQIKIDKQFQLADWRMRPLPDEMMFYARNDTHYLLYIYDRLKKDLADKSVNDNLLKAVWEASRQTCLKKYFKPMIREDSHMDLYRQSKKLFNDRQLYVLRELNYWRDKIGREEDESVHYVLPKHMMLQIAEVLPREMQGILACCNPVPPLVRQHLLTLHNIVLKGREMPLTLVQDEGRPLVQQIAAPSADQEAENPLHCPHDLTHSHDIRDDLPTLLGQLDVQKPTSSGNQNKTTGGNRLKLKSAPQISVFQDRDYIALSQTGPFTTPYMRYEAARQLAQQEQQEKQKADLQQRVENIRQHFLETVTETAGAAAEPAAPPPAPPKKSRAEKKKAAEPIAKKMEKKKRKRSKGPKITESSAQESPNKRPADGGQGQGPSPSKKVKQRQDQQQQQQEQQAPITPFDYSQVDYKEFQQNSSRQQRGGKRPSTRGNRNKQRSKMTARGGQRSMTYSNRT